MHLEKANLKLTNEIAYAITNDESIRCKRKPDDSQWKYNICVVPMVEIMVYLDRKRNNKVQNAKTGNRYDIIINFTNLMNIGEWINGIIVGCQSGHGDAVIQMEAGNNGCH